MTGHIYWKLGDLSAGSSPPGNGLSAAEWYLRQSIGGSNEIPTASSASTQGFGAVSNLYDGSSATVWASNSGDTSGSAFVAFQYSAAITPVQMFLQARSDSGFQQQTPFTGNLYYSDTGLTGPWTLYASWSVTPFTTVSQTQTYNLVPKVSVFAQRPAIVYLVNDTYTLVGTGLSSTPTLTQPTCASGTGIIYILDGNVVSVGVPRLAQPALTHNYSLSSSVYHIGAIRMTHAALAQNHALTGTGLSSTPTITATAVVVQDTYAVHGTGLSSTPTLAHAAIHQDHALAGTGITTGAPTVAHSVTVPNTSLTATGITCNAPTLVHAAIHQKQVLTATGITTGTPTLGEPACFTNQAFVGRKITAVPTITEPSLGGDQALVAENITFPSAPFVTVPTLHQAYALTSASMEVSTPTLALGILTRNNVCVGTRITTGTPTLATPTATINSILLGDYVHVRHPRLAKPACVIQDNDNDRTIAAGIPSQRLAVAGGSDRKIASGVSAERRVVSGGAVRIVP